MESTKARAPAAGSSGCKPNAWRSSAGYPVGGTTEEQHEREGTKVTRDEWVEIVDWIGARFTRPWTQKQVEAFYYDLRGFSLGAVKEAVHTIYSKGLTRPPTGSEILSLVIQISKDGELDKSPMDDCRHRPIDDEGYCTACAGFPKLGKLYSEVEDMPLDLISASTPATRQLLPTVAGEPPEDSY